MINIDINNIYHRRAIRTALAIFVGTFFYQHYSLTQGFWVNLTIIIVMQATIGATLRKGLQRTIGTIIGIVLGSLILTYVQNPIVINVCLVLFIFVAYYLKAFNLVNYGIFVIPLSIMVVFLIAALVPEEVPRLMLARIYDTLIGTVISILFTLFLLPSSLHDQVQQGLNNMLKTQADYFNAIINPSEQNPQLLLNARRAFDRSLTNNRQLFLDWRYEVDKQKIARQTYAHIIRLSEHLGQYLFSLEHLTKYPGVHTQDILSADLEGYQETLKRIEELLQINYSHEI